MQQGVPIELLHEAKDTITLEIWTSKCDNVEEGGIFDVDVVF